MNNNSRGNNKHGNQNEYDFVAAFNQGKENLNANLKQFVKYICQQENLIYDEIQHIQAQYETNNKLKQDVYLILDDHKYNISLKMGSGNSVHQEKCEDFVTYLQDYLDADSQVCDTFRFFLWGDGSLDGHGVSDMKDDQGRIPNRFSAKMFQDKFPLQRQILLDFIKKHERKLIEHFLFEGRWQSKVDYIYHGTPNYGTWIHKDKILDFQLENVHHNQACLPIGSMSMQSWNVSLKGTAEHKRGQLQIKYCNMAKDFELLMAKETNPNDFILGNLQETNFVQLMNKNKQHRFWKFLVNAPNYEDYYVVQVNSKQYSSLSHKKVFPKSDAYVIKTHLNRQDLFSKEFVLNETDLVGLNYQIIPETGISVKYKDSKHYTVQKFTIDSFLKIFQSYFNDQELREIALALLMYSNDNEVFKNYQIAARLEINYDEFLKNMQNKYGFGILTKNE